MDEKLLLSVREAAKLCGYSKSFLYQAMNAGKIPCIRIGRTARIPKIWLEKFIAEELLKWEKAQRNA